MTDVLKEGIPFWELPYPSFYDACKNAFKAGKFASGGPRWDSEWNSLMDNSDGKAPIVDMKTRYFMWWVISTSLGLTSILSTRRLDVGTVRRRPLSTVDRKGVPYGLG